MKKKLTGRILLLGILLLISSQWLQAQDFIYNIYESLARVNTSYTSFTFDANGAEIQDTSDDYHVQGIAYSNGYYYIVRSRPDNDNNEKLLIVKESAEEVVAIFDLDATSPHPGGIQICDTILAIPYTTTGVNGKISFYSISDPESPVFLSSYDTGLGNAYCVGITKYGNDYLVADYYSRPGRIKFCLFDGSFNLVKTQTWRAENQDTDGWYPFDEWRTESFNYENMSLVKTVPPGSTVPVYYMIMYHNTNTADIFSVNDPNLDDTLDINMIYSLQFSPAATGFRYAVGVEIVDADSLRFYSARRHLFSNKSSNIISSFEPRADWPWQLPYHYSSEGGDLDVAIDDNGICVEVYRGVAGAANEDTLYYQVGELDTERHQVNWGTKHALGSTGKFISVAMDNNGYCVEVYRGAGSDSTKHYYRVGQINAGSKTVIWGTNTFYDTGGDLAIAMDDNSHLVEVHRGSPGGGNKNNHYYRVGTVNTAGKTISWISNAAFYATGGYLSLAVDDSGNCLEVHRGSPGGSHENDCFYQVGSINFSTGAITWGNGINYQTGGNLDITMDDNGNCLEIHRGSPGGSNAHRHYYRFGTVNFGTGAVSWGTSQRYDVGGALAVSVSDAGNGIEIHLGEEGTAEASTLYYRLVEGESGSSFRTVTGSPVNPAPVTGEGFKIFPNPATQKMQLQFTSPAEGEIILTISDIGGKQLSRQNLGHYRAGDNVLKEVSLGSIHNRGVYFVNVSQRGKAGYTEKIVVY